MLSNLRPLCLCLLTIASIAPAMQKENPLQELRALLQSVQNTNQQNPATYEIPQNILQQIRSLDIPKDYPRIRQLVEALTSSLDASTYNQLQRLINARLGIASTPQAPAPQQPQLTTPPATSTDVLGSIADILVSLEPVFAAGTPLPSDFGGLLERLGQLQKQVSSANPMIQKRLLQFVEQGNSILTGNASYNADYKQLYAMLKNRTVSLAGPRSNTPSAPTPTTTIPVVTTTPATTAPVTPILSASASPVTALHQCPICFDEKEANQMTTLACGDQYCTDCLQIITTGALKTKSTADLKCPNPSCKKKSPTQKEVPFTQADINALITDKAQRDELSQIQLNEWAAQQHNIKQCPTPNCSFQFINERTDRFTMDCPDCKKRYCGVCLLNHLPATACAQAAHDNRIANNANLQQQANEQWLRAHTRPCPGCKFGIEKNTGCNHMKCLKCLYEFCWVCGQNWHSHSGSYYTCEFQPTDAQNASLLQAAPQAPQEEQITALNGHLFFARDPLGFENRLDRSLIDAHFRNRFERLSCEQRDEWVARITGHAENNQDWNWDGPTRLRIWIEELERIERTNRGGIQRPVDIITLTRYINGSVWDSYHDIVPTRTFILSIPTRNYEELIDQILIESGNRLRHNEMNYSQNGNFSNITFLSTNIITEQEVRDIIARINQTLLDDARSDVAQQQPVQEIVRLDQVRNNPLNMDINGQRQTRIFLIHMPASADYRFITQLILSLSNNRLAFFSAARNGPHVSLAVTGSDTITKQEVRGIIQQVNQALQP